MDKLVFFANAVPWTMHTKHSAYIASSFQEAGFKVKSYSCGGKQNFCYQKLVNARPFECIYCKARCLSNEKNFDYKSNYLPLKIQPLENEFSRKGIISSIGSSSRLEDDSLISTHEFVSKEKKIYKEYVGLVNFWIRELKKYKPFLFVIFNGRFHDTSAIIEACNNTNTKYICHERSWFGRGIYISFQENCISLANKKKLVHRAILKSLNLKQCEEAFLKIQDRFNSTNDFEWRKYGQKLISNSKGYWPCKDESNNILIMPSSRSEFFGEETYELDYVNSIEAYTRIIERYFAKNSSIVVRAHPGWKRGIGNYKKSESYGLYKEWARQNNFIFIEPDSDISSYELMKRSNFTLMNGGSSVVEANILGSNVITVSPSLYSELPFVIDRSKSKYLTQDLEVIDYETKFILSLRYLYFLIFKMPFFYDSIMPRTAKSNDFVYDKEYQINEVNRILETNESLPDLSLQYGEKFKLSRDERSFFKRSCFK